MPFFGSKSSFAVEANTIEAGQSPSRSRSILGHICFWVSGKQLGFYEDTVVLGAPACILGDRLVFQGERTDTEVNGKSKEKILAVIYDALYELGSSGEEKTYAECVQLADRFGKFDICTNSSEAFDGIFAVLVDVDDGSRFIWRSYEDEIVQEVKLAQGEYEDAVRAFLSWYHSVEKL